MESLLHGFTVVPQTQLMGCALLLYPHAPGCQWWDPFLLAPTAAAIVTSRKTCHLAEGNLHLPSSVSVMQPGYLPDFLTDCIRSLQCLQGNGLAWLPYLERIPKREFTSGWSRLLSLLVANSCLQITPLDPTCLGVLSGESVFTVCFTLKSTGKKCW